MVVRITYAADGTATYFVDGVEMTAEEVYRLCRPGGGQLMPQAHVRPKASDALAVHPRQVQEATEDAQRKGVPTEFLPDGRPVIRSRAHQKAYLKAYGFRNNDGGYGD